VLFVAGDSFYCGSEGYGLVGEDAMSEPEAVANKPISGVLGVEAEKSRESVDSLGLLLTASDALKRSIEHAVGQLSARKVKGDMKLKWSRSMVKQVEALIKVAEALERIEGKNAGRLDLATFLSEIRAKTPKRYIRKPLALNINKTRRNTNMQ
jgi:hypothetical protein